MAGTTAAETTNSAERTERITTPYLTKYERARILGTRALQIRQVLSAFNVLTQRKTANQLPY